MRHGSGPLTIPPRRLATQHRGVTVWAVKQDQASTSSGVMKARQRFLPTIRAAKGHRQQPQKPSQPKHLYFPTYVGCKLSPAQVLFSAGCGWYLEVAINKFPRPRSQAHSHWRPFQASRKNTNRAKWYEENFYKMRTKLPPVATIHQAMVKIGLAGKIASMRVEHKRRCDQ